MKWEKIKYVILYKAIEVKRNTVRSQLRYKLVKLNYFIMKLLKKILPKLHRIVYHTTCCSESHMFLLIYGRLFVCV